MNARDKKRIKQLADEGKMISKIQNEDFPNYGYWPIHDVVEDDSGSSSSLGAKKMISYKLKSLENENQKKKRTEIIKKINDQVWKLYDRGKNNQIKLEKIRETLDPK